MREMNEGESRTTRHTEKENKKRNPVRKRKIACSVIAILAIAAFCCGYVRINHKYPKAAVESVGENEPIETDGVQFTMKKAHLYTLEELEQMKDLPEDSMHIEEMRLLTLEMEIQNVSGQTLTFEAAYRRIETLGWSGGVSLVLYKYFNQENPRTVMELKDSEKRSYILPFIIAPQNFPEKEWAEIEKREFQYVLSLYPVKKVIEL